MSIVGDSCACSHGAVKTIEAVPEKYAWRHEKRMGKARGERTAEAEAPCWAATRAGAETSMSRSPRRCGRCSLLACGEWCGEVTRLCARECWNNVDHTVGCEAAW